MKKILYSTAITSLFSVLLLISACSDDTEKGGNGEKDKFSVAPDELSFENGSVESKSFTVTGGGSDWKFETEAEWFKTERSADRLTITPVDSNALSSPLSDEIVFTSTDGETVTVHVSQAGVTRPELDRHYSRGLDCPPRSISDNGRFIVGGTELMAMIWDTWNPDLKENVRYVPGDGVTASALTFYAVSNDGLVVGCVDNLPAVYDYFTDTWTMLDLSAFGIDDPQEAIGKGISGTARDITPDGKVIVGNYSSSFNGMGLTPVVWKGVNAKSEIAEAPVTDHVGITMPRGGYVLERVSDDGNIYAGRHSDHKGRWHTAIWNPGYQLVAPERVDYELEDGIFLAKKYSTFNDMSGNGRFIGGYYNRISGDGSKYDQHPYLYDRQTQSYSIADLEAATVTAITDDGLAFVIHPNTKTYVRTGYVFDGSTLVPFADWLLREHDIEINHTGGTIMDCSSDGRFIMGFYQTSGLRTYIIRL